MPAAPIQLLNPEAIQALIRDLGELPKELQKRGKLRRLMEEIRDEVLIPEFMDQFLEGGKPPWEPVTATTLSRRKRGGGESFAQEGRSFRIGSQPPLTDTGQLRRAATAKRRFHIRRNIMTYGNFPRKQWYAIPIHEKGEAAKIPRRSWVSQTFTHHGVVEEITDVTWDWIRDRIDDALPRRRYI